MRNLYWMLAAGVAIALIAAAWFASQLGTEGPAEPDPTTTAASSAPESIAQAQIDAPVEAPTAARAILPSFDTVRVSRNGTGVIAGRGEPGSRVELLVNGQPAASAMADENGEWVMILSKPLKKGATTLSLSADLDGVTSQSTDLVTIQVPDDPSLGVLAVKSARDGSGASQALQVPGPSSGGIDLRVSAIDFLPDGTVLVSGTGTAGNRMLIYVNNAYVNEVVADDAGEWLLNVGAIDAGEEHELRVDMLAGEDGGVTLRMVQTFSRGTALGTYAPDRSVIIAQGDNLWSIARQLYGGGELYSLIFKENAAQIRNPDLIYPGQVFDLPSDGAEPGR